MSSLARQGLDQLLAHHPTADLIRAEDQTPNGGHWTTITLQEEDGQWNQYAIWNRTGNVYRLDQHGAAEDDPYLTPSDPGNQLLAGLLPLNPPPSR